MSSNEQCVCLSQHESPFCSGSLGPSTHPSQNYEYCRLGGYVNDDVRSHCGAPDSYVLPTGPSFFSDVGGVDNILTECGYYPRAQQDTSGGFPDFFTNCVPHSPIPDFSHPWDVPSQPSEVAFSDTPAVPQNDRTFNLSCALCMESFSGHNNLNRHLQTKHRLGKEYWVCTVKGCKKKGIPNYRKDNFRRHVRSRHPTVDFEKFGL